MRLIACVEVRGEAYASKPLVVGMDGTSNRAPPLDLAAFPCALLLETVATAGASADAVSQALEVILGGYAVGILR